MDFVPDSDVFWSIAKGGRNVSDGTDEMPEQQSPAGSVALC